MSTIGDVKVSVVLDNSKLNENIRTAIVMLNDFRARAEQLLNLKLDLDISKLDKSLSQFKTSINKLPSDVEILRGALNGLNSIIQGIGGKFGPITELLTVFYQLIKATPPEVRILIGALTVLSAGLVILATEATIATGGLNLLSAAIATGVALIISGITDWGTSMEELDASVSSTMGNYKKSIDDINRREKSISTLSDLYRQLSVTTVLSKDEQQSLNEKIQAAGLLYPAIITGVDSLTGQYQTNAESIKSVIENENELLRIRQQSAIYEVIQEIVNLTDKYEDEIEKASELEAKQYELQKSMEDLVPLIQSNEEKLVGLTNAQINNNGELANSQAQLRFQRQEYDGYVRELQKVEKELNKNSLGVSHLTIKFEEFIAMALQTNTIEDLFTQLTAKLGSTSESVRLLQGAFVSMGSGAIANILGVTENMKNFGEVMLKIQKIVNLASSPNPNWGEINKLVNEIKSMGNSLTPDKDPKINQNKSKTRTSSYNSIHDDKDENLLKYETDIRKIGLDTETAQHEGRANEFFYQDQIKRIDALFEVVDSIVDETVRQESKNNLYSEKKKLTHNIEQLQKESRDKNLADQKEWEEKRAKERDEQVKIFEAISDTHEKNKDLEIELIPNEYDKKRGKIRREYEKSVKGRDRKVTNDPEYIDNQYKLMDRALSETNAEQFEATVNSTLAVAQNISGILGLGADTFASKLISGLQSGISLANSVVQLLANLGTGGLGGGIFGLLGGIFGFAQGGRVPGTGTGDTVPAMLTPGEFVIRKDVVDKFGSSFFAWINGGLFPSMAGHYAMGGMVSPSLMNSDNNNVYIASSMDGVKFFKTTAEKINKHKNIIRL